MWTRMWSFSLMSRVVVVLLAFRTALGQEEKKVARHGEMRRGLQKKNYFSNYEVWGSDQSNSVSGQSSKGVKGSYLWVWDADSIQNQLKGGGNAVPKPCTPTAKKGPCDVLDIFPGTLQEYDTNGKPTGNTLADLDGFGRLHGTVKDPFNRYVSMNIFAPSGGYIGIIDAQTKEAVGLFRVTKFAHSGTKKSRSVHMCFWTTDGTALLVNNLHGKALERIDVTRDNTGKILSLKFNTNAGLGLGKAMSVVTEATYFGGRNAFGRNVVGSITGDYSSADLGNLTPNGVCKESGCGGKEPAGGGRGNNVNICPVPSTNGNVYLTLGGGGLLVVRQDTTPMRIVGEYGNTVVNGAGVCGEVQVGNTMFINNGISASGAGATQSAFGLYAFDDTKFAARGNAQNSPMPVLVFKDATSTNTIGNTQGKRTSDLTGQIPGKTTRRDAHGLVRTSDGKYVHAFDRILNVVEVFDSRTFKHEGTYDLVSKDGKSGRTGAPGPCLAASVTDDKGLVLNDPASDLVEATPDGKYIMVGLRGPVPVTVGHAGQGSCPGVGIVEITESGKSGKLVGVLRTSNLVDTVPTGKITGGRDYTGAERSDVHMAMVLGPVDWQTTTFAWKVTYPSCRRGYWTSGCGQPATKQKATGVKCYGVNGAKAWEANDNECTGAKPAAPDRTCPATMPCPRCKGCKRDGGCWKACGGKAGACSACTSRNGRRTGACCQKGNGSDPMECKVAEFQFESDKVHTCALLPADMHTGHLLKNIFGRLHALEESMDGLQKKKSSK